MREELQKKCDLLADNKQKLGKIFAMNTGYMLMASALILTNAGVVADKDSLKDMVRIIHDKTGILSEFRGNTEIPMACKMLISGDGERYFQQVEKVYRLLNTSKWMGSEYKILAAMTICEHTEEAYYETYVNKTNELYKRMKEAHKWLTNEEDIPFAAILAATDLDIDALVEEMEACYSLLKPEFHDNDAVQSLSHVLAAGSQSAAEKAERVKAIFKGLKDTKHKFGTSRELSTLGSLAVTNIPVEEIIADISEMDDYLKEKKGFGNFSLGETSRRFFVAQLLMSDDIGMVSSTENAMVSSMVAITVATEVAMMLCITAAVTSAMNN